MRYDACHKLLTQGKGNFMKTFFIFISLFASTIYADSCVDLRFNIIDNQGLQQSMQREFNQLNDHLKKAEFGLSVAEAAIDDSGSMTSANELKRKEEAVSLAQLEMTNVEVKIVLIKSRLEAQKATLKYLNTFYRLVCGK